MKILVTGATGYIGASVARALKVAGHDVFGLARSPDSAARLELAGLAPVAGDFADPASLAAAVLGVDAVVSTASTAAMPGQGNGFDRDQVAVTAMIDALRGSGKLVIFTSGSAVIGTFTGGACSDEVHDEYASLPLAPDSVAPPHLNLNPMLTAALGAAMRARIDTEKAVLTATGVRGVVIRPGLVYGYGGSFDIPALISAARALGGAPHFGEGAFLHSYLHIDDLGELYRLTVEKALRGTVIHGAAADVSMKDLAGAVNTCLGIDAETVTVSLDEMYAAAGPPGISLALSKRLDTQKTRDLLGWAPGRTDILEDVATGSYAS
ncbi:MAG: NAD-dependent epimerase/dehydratase family protein [Sphingomonas sp.]|jgi:nucleoside-diphosphate-sugar epimerase|uniref:NAD-dependent epimerase/dehydratase family protein n=1 Tax=Sphingomonas sp. TaxID=28214 RepID=UPI003564AA3D